MELTAKDRLSKDMPAKLRAARKARNLSVGELASRTQIGSNTLLKWEAGESKPWTALFDRVLKVLEETPAIIKPATIDEMQRTMPIPLYMQPEIALIKELKRRGYSVTLTM